MNEREKFRARKRKILKLNNLRMLAEKNKNEAIAITEAIGDGFSPLVQEKISKAEHYLNRISNIENRRFILSDDPDAREKLAEKIRDLKLLADYFKACNKSFKNTGQVTQRMTDHWKAQIESNILEHGRPFTEKNFNSIRRMVKFCKERIKNIERADTIQTKTLMIAGDYLKYSVTTGRIVVKFPWIPDHKTRKALRANPLLLRYSYPSRAWVRKYTGQCKAYFDALCEVLKASKNRKRILKPKNEVKLNEND